MTPEQEAQCSEALVLSQARVERLEQLLALYRDGNLPEKELALAIDEAVARHEAERPTWNLIYSESLGPFDLEVYGRLQEMLGRKIERWQQAREAYEQEEGDWDAVARASLDALALWHELAPWRNALQEEVESSPAFVEAARRDALRAAGFRPPTERNPRKKKKDPLEELYKAGDRLRRAWKKVAHG